MKGLLPPGRLVVPLTALLLTLAVVPGRAAHAGDRGGAGEVATVDLRGLEARSAALLLSGQDAGDLEASFLAVPMAGPQDSRRLLLVADLVGTSLLEAAAGPGMIVEAYAYALDAAGSLRATMARAFRLDLDTYRSALERGGVKLLAALELPPGPPTASLRLLVLHRASGRLALRTLPVAAELPTEPAVPLLALESGARWLVVRGDDRLPPPLDDDRRPPATRLVATAGGRLLLRPAVAAGSAPVARLLAADGEVLAELAPAAPRSGDAGEAPPGDAELDLSAWGPEGYLLELLDPRQPGRVLRLPLDLVAERLPEDALWFERLPPDAGAATAPAAPPPVARRSALQRQALAAYRRALDAWQQGGLEAAAAELRRFEAGAVGVTDDVGGGIDIAQSRAAAELAAADGESLVPLMCVHERLSRAYQRRQSYQLATHSRRMALGLARHYAERGGEEARRTAALVLVSLAGMRQEIGARLDAMATFEAALEMDPRQPEALHALAALHESLAHYETAVDLLRRMERAGALSQAAGLRLAINLGREGATRQAAARLRELLEARPDWVARLAYQELARLLIRTQRADEALELLVAARRRYPEDQGLTLQEAALLDRLGKPLAGQRVLAAFDTQAGDRGESPRLRYSALRSEEIAAARRRLARAAADRLAAAAETARAVQESRAP